MLWHGCASKPCQLNSPAPFRSLPLLCQAKRDTQKSLSQPALPVTLLRELLEGGKQTAQPSAASSAWELSHAGQQAVRNPARSLISNLEMKGCVLVTQANKLIPPVVFLLEINHLIYSAS